MYSTYERTIKDKIEIVRFENHHYSYMHYHNFLEISYIVSGNADHQIGEHNGKLKKGNYFIVDYNMPHTYTSKYSNLSIINCLFLPEFLDSSFPNMTNFNQLCEQFYFKQSGRLINGPASNIVFSDDDGSVGELFLRMHKEYTEKKEGYLLMLRQLLYQIMIETVRKVGSNDKISDCTLHITHYINENYSKKISLTEVCKELGYSLPYISAKFRKETGLTFTQYLQSRRMEEAYTLLSDTNMLIIDIAEKCGYDNVKFFGKVFKETTSMSPREFRSLRRRK